MKRKHLACLLTSALALMGCGAGDTAPSEGPVAEEQAAATPATGHPRLWIRQSDLPRLQSWASASNPMFTQGLLPAVQQAIDTYDTQFYPGGQENPNWPDPGIDNTVYYATESYAEIFAFMSLVDPDPNARAQHAQRAKNLLMHAMNEAAKGVDTGSNPAPFRSSGFATYNRANYWGEAWGLTVDWIYPSLSAAEKATIRKVFLRWSNECLNASTTSAEHPQPVGVTNDPELLADKQQLRWAANNYFTGHMRALTMMSLAFDAADDPPVDTSQPATKLGNSVRSYLTDVTGAWLYQQYAVYEDPAVSSTALGVPASGLGVAAGGLSVEGALYGESLGYLHEALLALYTAGYADTTLSGPQAGLVTSAYWDRYTNGMLHNIAPAGKAPDDPSYGYMGQVWQMGGYGDMLRFWMTPEFIMPIASIGILDQMTGNQKRRDTMRWLAENVLEGGPTRLMTRAGAVWGNAYASNAILYFMLFDPSLSTAADPRPGLPTTFVDKSLGRVLSRTDWSPSASWFTYLCGWETINHQNGACNQFELYRKGEWLTKELTGYANDMKLMTSDYNNTLAIQNDVPQGINWFEEETSARGGQWTNGANAGDPKFASSEGAGWVYATADATNLYNRPGWDAAHAAMDVSHASRAVVYLKPDHVVVYDRATTKTANRFKRFNLTLTGAPTVSGKKADVVTPGGQHLFVQTLLPAGATLTASQAETIDRVSELEPAKYRLVVQDPSNPADVRFLHVLQGADAGASADTTTLVQSTSGTAFQGAVVKGMAVMFQVDPSAAFTGTTYVIPAGVTTHLVTGLAPSTGYTVTTAAVSSGLQITLSAGGSATTDAAGVLVVAGGSSQPPPPPTTTCTYAISPSSAHVTASSATGTLSVNVGAGCTWTAASNAGWITVTSGSSGTAAGSVGYSVAANTGTSARTGTITVAGQTFTVDQDGAAAPPPPPPTCTYGITPSSAHVTASSATGSLSVNAGSGCAWTAASNAGWITVTSGSSGTAAGSVGYSVAANTGTSARTGTITVAGQTFTVDQDAPAPTTTCSYSLPVTSVWIGKGGGTKTFSLNTSAGCPWLAASGASWIWVYQPTSGTGSATIKFKVPANKGAARTGVINVGGQTFKVKQQAGY